MNSSETFFGVFPIVGTIIGILVNLSHGILFTEIVKHKRDYTEIPEMMLVSNLLCNWINLSLGFIRNDYIIIVSSSIGTALALSWAIWYLFYYAQSVMKQFLVFAFIATNLTIEFVWVFGFIMAKDWEVVTGVATIIITIVNFATPGQNIHKVIKTGRHMLIPIFTTLTCLLCSSCWLIYGITQNDYKLYVPNGLGLLFGLLQLTVWAIYFCKERKLPIKDVPKAIPNSFNNTNLADYEYSLTNDSDSQSI